MAVLRNTAEGQTSGTALTAANSGGGSGTAFDSVANSGGATVAYSNAQAWRGSQSYTITAGSSATTTMLFNSAGDMNGSLQAFFYFPSYPSANTSLMAAYVGGAIASAFINSTGALVIDNAAGGAIYTSSAGTIALNTWVRIDLCVTVGTTTSNGRVQAAVSNGTSGTPIASYDSGNTVNTGTTAFTSYRFGKQNTTPSIATFYMDDIAAASGVQQYIDPIVTSVAFVQGNANYTTTTGATTFPVAFSSSVTAGNLIVIALCFQSSTATGSITDSQGNTYTAAVGPTNNILSGLDFRDYIFYTVASTSGSNTVTAHISTSSTYIRVLLHEYSGVNTLDATAAATGGSGVPNSGSATTRFTNELIFGWGMTGNGTTSADTGFTLRETAFAESTEDKMVFSSGSYNVTYPSDGTPWIAQMATFYAAPGGTTAWLEA